MPGICSFALILLFSGDIELNPGPQPSGITVPGCVQSTTAQSYGDVGVNIDNNSLINPTTTVLLFLSQGLQLQLGLVYIVPLARV